MRSGIGKLARSIVALGAIGFAVSLAQPASAQMDFSRMLLSGDRSDNRQVGYYDNGYAQSPPNYQGNNPNRNQNGPDYQRSQYYSALRERAHDNSARQPTPAQQNNQNTVAQTGYYQQANGNRQYRDPHNDVPQNEMLMADASANETPVQAHRPIRSVVAGPGAAEAMHPSPTAVFIEGNKVLVGQIKGGETIMPGMPTQRYRSMMPGGSTIQNGQPMPGPASQAGPVTWGPMQYENGSDGGMMGDGQMMGDGGPMMGGPPPSCGCGCDGYTNPFCNDCSCACSGQHGCGFGKHYSSCCGGGCGNNCGGGCCGGSGGGCGGDGGGGGYGGGCGGNCCNPYGRPWFLAPIDRCLGIGPYADSCNDWYWTKELTVYGGVHSFKVPSDVILTGPTTHNFGFQQGLNWAMPIVKRMGLNGQVGVEFTQSDLFGTASNDDVRTQIFLTAGLFHRPDCCEGLQYGVVYDWLHNDFNAVDTFDVGQIRAEVSWLCDCRNEVGFWFGTGVMDAQFAETVSQYNFFYQRRFCSGGDIRFLVGIFNDGGDTGDVVSKMGPLVGVDFEVPLAKCWSIDGGFTYLIPSSNPNHDGFGQESWNLGFNLVYHFGCNACCNCDPYRPLFNVANNGSLMTTSTAPATR